MSTADPILQIENLRVTFGAGAKPVRAVDGVDLALKRGEVVALLGESGSGKSVTLRSVLRLHPPKKTRIEGRIAIEGVDVMSLDTKALADFRGKTVSMIFQEPMLALDPVYSVGRQITEAI
ncbi:MAG: ATP-binding cassette domain-containing protein, partial [Burkholderiales bacterium]